MSESLDAFARRVLDDGVIDADEVAEIRARLYADDVIDEDEANFLFALNDGKTSAGPAWQELFVEALTDFLLSEDPNTLSAARSDWLADRIEGDGEVDELERSLLMRLSDEGVTLSERLARLL